MVSPRVREYSMNIASLTSEFGWDQVFPDYYGCLQKVRYFKVFKACYLRRNMEKTTKEEARAKVEEFFTDLRNKSPEQIKKIKKLAMKYNLKLGEKRKGFCKKCYSSLEKAEVRIKNGKKIVKCRNCSQISRWDIR